MTGMSSTDNLHQFDRHMIWGNLRVWTDDIIAAQSRFPPHPHRDMEIITYERAGAITHVDNLGNNWPVDSYLPVLPRSNASRSLGL
jgi:redox-sensitive bicupin YhaK (pirin superfamily)